MNKVTVGLSNLFPFITSWKGNVKSPGNFTGCFSRWHWCILLEYLILTIIY